MKQSDTGMLYCQDGNRFAGAEELEGAGVNAERHYRLFDDNEDGVLDKTEYLGSL